MKPPSKTNKVSMIISAEEICCANFPFRVKMSLLSIKSNCFKTLIFELNSSDFSKISSPLVALFWIELAIFDLNGKR